MRGSRSLSSTARPQASSSWPSCSPSSSSWARRGCTPSWARRCPWLFSCPVAAKAPSWSSCRRASCRCAGAGGSIQCRSLPRGSPHWASCRARGRGSTSSNSGGSKGGRRCCSAGDQRRRQRPGPRRPALPARCSALAWLAGTVTRPSSPLPGSKRLRRLRPLSSTRATPAKVRELSAIEVASTTLPVALLAGPIARPWASRGRLPCRGTHSTPRWLGLPHSVAAIALLQSWISLSPGRKTSTVSPSPRCSSQCCSRARTTCGANFSPGRGGWWLIATG